MTAADHDTIAELLREWEQTCKTMGIPYRAEDAAEFVDGKAFRVLLPILPGTFHADDVDTVRRAGRGTQEAGDAFHSPLFVLVQSMHTAVDLRIAQHRLLVRIRPRGAAMDVIPDSGDQFGRRGPR